MTSLLEMLPGFAPDAFALAVSLVVTDTPGALPQLAQCLAKSGADPTAAPGVHQGLHTLIRELPRRFDDALVAKLLKPLGFSQHQIATVAKLVKGGGGGTEAEDAPPAGGAKRPAAGRS
jgi:hypothetical protein